MEEAYMIKKQQSLNVHCIPCDKIAERFRMVRGADQEDINQTEFSSVLAACKLLKADFPTKDERWCRFYSKFIVMDLAEQNGPQHKRYSLLPTQIALFFLAMGTLDVKAKAICDLFLVAPVNKQKNEEQYEQ